ncbi:hypothetical protein [Dyadobacter sandarakinus]|uniref:Phage integrase SAM-like domain-containing protein n=1 Tax=Dyadobacter sandarakinus TaxID=2747268 RepID=A0ABX7I1M8_9BACT|nr:hypothetical protein [Dyadobacter sandarakinus]QRQ99759.1 hypothetical protein HWI92_01905 [Dyadobacter sandarakinus]
MTDLVINFDAPDSKLVLYDALRSLRGEHVIKIKKRSKGRSLQQNKYYWVILQYIADYTGHSTVFLHEYYKHEFIPLVKFQDDYRLTTSDMTTQQISDYIDLAREHAASLEVVVPDADGVIP